MISFVLECFALCRSFSDFVGSAMSARNSNDCKVGCLLVFPLVFLLTIIVGIVALVRVEAELKALIQARQLNELMDAAGMAAWQPLAEIHGFGLRLGVLFTVSVAILGLRLRIGSSSGIVPARNVVLLVLLSFTMAAIGIYNFYAMCRNQCLQQYSDAVFSLPVDAEERLNQLLCSAWCYTNTSVPLVSSCGDLPSAFALEYATRMRISKWCTLLLQPHTRDSKDPGVSPYQWMRYRDLHCGPLDGWANALCVLTAFMTTFCCAGLVLAGAGIRENGWKEAVRSREETTRTAPILDCETEE